MPLNEVEIAEIQTLLTQDKSPENFLTQTAKYVYAGAWQPLIQAFAKRHQEHQDGLQMLLHLFTHPRLVQDHQNLNELRMMQGVAAESIIHIYILFFRGCYLFRAGEVEMGRQVFRYLNQVIEQTGLSVDQMPYITTLKNTAEQFFTPLEIEKTVTTLQSEDNSLTYYGAEALQNKASEQVYFAACNQVYFDKFAEDFLGAFEAEGPVHIHVVNGDEEILSEFIAKHQDKDVVVSSELYDGVENSPFYASLRFLRALEVMSRYESNLVIADVDTAHHDGLSRFLSESQKGDVGVFHSLNIVPWYSHMATGMFIKNSEGGRLFLEYFSKMLRHTLAKPTWYVDQSVLLSVCDYLNREIPSCQIQYLRQEEDFFAQRMFYPAADESEKSQIRQGVSDADY